LSITTGHRLGACIELGAPNNRLALSEQVAYRLLDDFSWSSPALCSTGKLPIHHLRLTLRRALLHAISPRFLHAATGVIRKLTEFQVLRWHCRRMIATYEPQIEPE